MTTPAAERKLAAIMFTDGAFASLVQAAAEHSYYAAWWKVDPDLDLLRSDPHFAELRKTVGHE